MDFRLPIPKNWQDFESICHRLWSEIWNDPNAEKNGRQGQIQNGVDIFGTPIYSKQFAGVQCKDKDGQLGSSLESKELISECRNAKSFKPTISSFTLATTASRDASIQKIARQISDEQSFPFSVQVWSWDDIQSEIAYRPSIINHYYSGLTLPLNDQTIITLNRYSSKEQFIAYFTRPAVKNILSNQLKEFLISIAYELSDNAYMHGKATNFNIAVQSKKITFKDDGKSFNPLSELNPYSTTAANNVGSFVFDTFQKKFDKLIDMQYSRVTENAIEQNVLEFNLSDDFDPIDKKDFLELYVDWRQAAGRDAARKLVYSISITPDIKDIIWTVTDSYALSFFSEFIIAILERLTKTQRLILSLPRDEMYSNIEKWYNDERLIFQRR